MHINIHINMDIYTHIYIHINIHTCTYIHTYTWPHTLKHTTLTQEYLIVFIPKNLRGRFKINCKRRKHQHVLYTPLKLPKDKLK